MTDINTALNIESMRLSGCIFTGMDIKIYAKDPWFPDEHMGPFDNDEAAHNAYLIRSSASAFTHGGRWYFVHSGERFGPYDTRLDMVRAQEAKAELAAQPSLAQIFSLPDRSNRRSREDMRTMFDVLTRRIPPFEPGDIVSLHPLCGYYPKIRHNGGEAIFIKSISRQKMKPDSMPIEGLYSILEADCHMGYFDEDGDFIELYADSRFFTLAETSN